MDSKIYVIASTTIMMLAGIVLAAVTPLSPPPVEQKLGVYDTIFFNLTESKCRECHISGVSSAHHMLVEQGRYICGNCHPNKPDGSGVIYESDCLKCHDNTFYGLTVRRPHHETVNAQARNCSTCHGNFVDDYDDEHYIPTSAPSEVTPDTKFKEINQTSGRKWGGCESCHEKDPGASPIIQFNNKTHHTLGSLSGFNPPNNSRCFICHNSHDTGQYGSDSVRYCESCHGIKSLHNIQFDYVNTSGSAGYGHIGDGNKDCEGCHAWYVAGGDADGNIIIPSISIFNPGKLIEGQSTVLTIDGHDLATAIGSSVVVITDGVNTITLTPTSMTSSQMIVTVPALSKGYYGIYALKGGSKSNRLPLVVGPNVIVSSAKKSGTTITILGSGFGDGYDPAYKDRVNVTIYLNKKGVLTYRNVVINGWTNSQIGVTSSDAAIADIVVVNSVYGTNSTKVTGGK